MKYNFKSDKNGKTIEPYQIIGEEIQGGLVIAPVNEANKYNYIDQINDSFNIVFIQMNEKSQLFCKKQN